MVASRRCCSRAKATWTPEGTAERRRHRSPRSRRPRRWRWRDQWPVDMAKAPAEAGANVNDCDFWSAAAVHGGSIHGTARASAWNCHAWTRPPASTSSAVAGEGRQSRRAAELRPPYRNAVQDRGADGTLIRGATPPTRAATGGDIPALKLLLAAGAKVDLPDEDAAPLSAPDGRAVSASGTRRNKTEEQAIEAVKLLRAAGAAVNVSDTRGLTAAHSAAFRGWNAMLKELAANGANLDAREADKSHAAGLRAGPQSHRFPAEQASRAHRTPASLAAAGRQGRKPPTRRRGPASEPLD